MWGHYGSKTMGIFSGPLNEALGSITDICWWYRSIFYEGLCPICFSKELALVVPYLCFRFHIFNIPVLEEYVF